MKVSEQRKQLRADFEAETGIDDINWQGEPDIDYILWLETKVLKHETLKHESGDFRDPDNFESQNEYFGY